MKYVKQKLPGFKSGINYDDLESEIARFEKERQSAENEHKLVHERLASLLETNDWDKAEFEGVWRDSEKIDFKLIYLTSLVDRCQMIKDGTVHLQNHAQIEPGVMTQSSTGIWRTNIGKGRKSAKIHGTAVYGIAYAEGDCV